MFNYDSGIIDPYINLQNDNMLYAQVDAILLPIARMGFGGTEVHVSKSGWPSKGEPG
jgi:hypothetical protein